MSGSIEFKNASLQPNPALVHTFEFHLRPAVAEAAKSCLRVRERERDDAVLLVSFQEWKRND